MQTKKLRPSPFTLHFQEIEKRPMFAMVWILPLQHKSQSLKGNSFCVCTLSMSCYFCSSQLQSFGPYKISTIKCFPLSHSRDFRWCAYISCDITVSKFWFSKISETLPAVCCNWRARIGKKVNILMWHNFYLAKSKKRFFPKMFAEISLWVNYGENIQNSLDHKSKSQFVFNDIQICLKINGIS